ncbi:hypothetical protein FNV43_RR07892 [Rhamnella rubrinervis]|uniref:Uncharacterized protein n=1 Tax=Rhamnella rubrinervis TaxID=2594499 RepID=A0A8K0HG40_9ROSA|nr:hypothetical protein FNV43_RR07892 [Rhamnella rubrinervis]
MKKLYRKGTVHPSPPIISDHLSFLPAAILTLTAALSQEDREVLAYLISCSNSSVNLSSGGQVRKTTQRSYGKGVVAGVSSGDHPPQFNCNCFRCYTSFWVRWDASPNRQLIHEIIDAFEDGLQTQNKGVKSNSRKERRKRGGCGNGSGELKRSEPSSGKEELDGSKSVQETSSGCGGGSDGGDEGAGEEESEKGSVRRFVSFIGERIWGVWNE